MDTTNATRIKLLKLTKSHARVRETLFFMETHSFSEFAAILDAILRKYPPSDTPPFHIRDGARQVSPLQFHYTVSKFKSKWLNRAIFYPNRYIEIITALPLTGEAF